ncbi:MAG TPA: multidrug effflux MFS transporter [Geminicoccaceae bacterium]|nr:multidrug effflux MFS transporter [Geminicoccaceae bacterium]
MIVKPRTLAPGSPAFVALIASLIAMTAMTIDINLPAIPAIARDLGTSQTSAQLTVTLFFLGMAAGQAIYGSASDRFGRKPVLVTGIVLFILTSIACAMATDIRVLLALRIVQGFAAASGSVLGRAVVRDLFEGPQMARVMSFAMAAFVTVPIVAPSLGALLLKLGSWRWVFVFLVAYGTLILLLSTRWLVESLPRPDPAALQPGRLLRAWARVFRARDTLVYGAIGTLISGGLVVYLTNAPAVFMTTYGLSPDSFGLLFAAIAVCAVASNLANARLVRKVGLPRLVWLGILVTGASIAASLAALLALWDSPWVLVLGFGGFFFGFGFVFSNGTALALQPHGAMVGTASAAVGVVQSVVPAAIASLVAAAYDGTAVPMLAAMLALVVAAGAIFAFTRRLPP